MHAVKGAVCLAVGIVANVLVAMTLGSEVVAPAHAQFEQGGPDAALRQRKNDWTVGVAGGQLSGTYMTFVDELAQAFAERLIGSIRRECVDHVIALGEQHFRQVLKAYARYCNTARIHRSLDKDAPISRPGPRRAAMLLLADEVSPHNN